MKILRFKLISFNKPSFEQILNKKPDDFKYVLIVTGIYIKNIKAHFDTKSLKSTKKYI